MTAALWGVISAGLIVNSLVAVGLYFQGWRTHFCRSLRPWSLLPWVQFCHSLHPVLRSWAPPRGLKLHWRACVLLCEKTTLLICPALLRVLPHVKSRPKWRHLQFFFLLSEKNDESESYSCCLYNTTVRLFMCSSNWKSDWILFDAPNGCTFDKSSKRRL